MGFLRLQQTRPRLIDKATMRSLIPILTFSDSRSKSYAGGGDIAAVCDQDDA